MLRRVTVSLVLVVAALAVTTSGCDDGKAKAKEIGQKVDQALDKLDTAEAQKYFDDAKAALAKGLDASEACSWVRSRPADQHSAAVDGLRTLCNHDVPLARATRAVTLAEAARAEVPAAPTLTECSSDTWPAARQQLERDYPTDPALADLKARWAKVCP